MIEDAILSLILPVFFFFSLLLIGSGIFLFLIKAGKIILNKSKAMRDFLI